MSSYPKISIVTPSYNQGAFIEKTIKSIISQDYPNLEYIIMDGGSTDNTLEVIKKYEKDIDFWVSESDGGQASAINKGFEKATGDYLMWVNSDDYLLPGALKKYAHIHNTNDTIDIIVGLGRLIDLEGNVVLETPPIDEVTLISLYNWRGPDNKRFAQPSSIFSRKVWETCGPLDESLNFLFDLDFWLKAKLKKFDFYVINEYLSEEHYHNNQKMTAYRHLANIEIAVVIIRHGGDKYQKKYLDQMAEKLYWYEKKFGPLLNSRLYKTLGRAKRILTRR